MAEKVSTPCSNTKSPGNLGGAGPQLGCYPPMWGYGWPSPGGVAPHTPDMRANWGFGYWSPGALSQFTPGITANRQLEYFPPEVVSPHTLGVTAEDGHGWSSPKTVVPHTPCKTTYDTPPVTPVPAASPVKVLSQGHANNLPYLSETHVRYPVTFPVTPHGANCSYNSPIRKESLSQRIQVLEGENQELKYQRDRLQKKVDTLTEKCDIYCVCVEYLMTCTRILRNKNKSLNDKSSWWKNYSDEIVESSLKKFKEDDEVIGALKSEINLLSECVLREEASSHFSKSEISPEMCEVSTSTELGDLFCDTLGKDQGSVPCVPRVPIKSDEDLEQFFNFLDFAEQDLSQVTECKSSSSFRSGESVGENDSSALVWGACLKPWGEQATSSGVVSSLLSPDSSLEGVSDESLQRSSRLTSSQFDNSASDNGGSNFADTTKLLIPNKLISEGDQSQSETVPTHDLRTMCVGSDTVLNLSLSAPSNLENTATVLTLNASTQCNMGSNANTVPTILSNATCNIDNADTVVNHQSSTPYELDGVMDTVLTFPSNAMCTINDTGTISATKASALYHKADTVLTISLDAPESMVTLVTPVSSTLYNKAHNVCNTSPSSMCAIDNMDATFIPSSSTPCDLHINTDTVSSYPPRALFNLNNTETVFSPDPNVQLALHQSMNIANTLVATTLCKLNTMGTQLAPVSECPADCDNNKDTAFREQLSNNVLEHNTVTLFNTGLYILMVIQEDNYRNCLTIRYPISEIDVSLVAKGNRQNGTSDLPNSETGFYKSNSFDSKSGTSDSRGEGHDQCLPLNSSPSLCQTKAQGPYSRSILEIFLDFTKKLLNLNILT